jgi:hypothetical protein
MEQANLPNDVVRYIEKRFPRETCREAISIVLSAKTETSEFPSPRLLRCAVYASEGRIDHLRHYVALLAIDWRDVVMAGENEKRDGKTVCVRDFSKSMQVHGGDAS